MPDGGGGSSECLPMDDLVGAMLRNSQALAEALAVDRARREAALKEKDAEIDRLRAESADVKKKLQADASRKMRWEEAYELLLGANQKLAELRDADMADSRTCAEIPNSKEVESFTKLSQNTVDHTASDFGKLKQDYETLSSKKDKEVSALLSEKDSVRNQLDIMQQNYAELLKNKEVEAAQATEAALKLQKSVDELKVLAQNKDDEIAKLQAEVVGAKKEHCADFSALLSEKDSVHNQLTVMQQDYTELLKSKKVLTQKNDHEIVILLSGKDSLHKQLVRREQDYAELLKNKKVEAAQATEAALNLQKSVHDLKVLVQKKDNEIGRLRAEAVCAKKKVHQIHSLVKEKDDGIPRLKVWHPESVQKQYKDISEIHKQSRSGDPAVTLRHKLKSGEDYISQTKIVEKDGQEETTQKHMHVYSMSNDNEKSGSDLDDDEPIGSDEDGDKQSRSNENGDKQCRSHDDGDKKSRTGDVDGQSRSNEDEHKLSGSDDETTNNQSQNPPRNPKRKRDACNAETANGKSHRKTNG